MNASERAVAAYNARILRYARQLLASYTGDVKAAAREAYRRGEASRHGSTANRWHAVALSLENDREFQIPAAEVTP